MTGSDHYKEAERFLGIVINGELLHTPDMRLRLATVAQVHATLALAAATALGNTDGMLSEDANAWQDTAGFPLRSGGAE